MMNIDRKALLKILIQEQIGPILLSNDDIKTLKKATIIDALSSSTLMCGHYENDKFCPPFWYTDLLENKNKILVINNLNKLPFIEQRRFVEILKYNKVDVFELPSNCLILVSVDNLNNSLLCEDVYSLLVRV